MKNKKTKMNSIEYNINDVSSFTQNVDKKYSENNCITNTSDNFQKRKKRKVIYAINLDWLQIVCMNPNKMIFNNYKDKNILIIKNDTNNKPNFHHCYSIKVNDKPIITLYSNPRNKHIYKESEVMLEIQNVLLYDSNWNQLVTEILDSLSLKFLRIVRLDIALDSENLIKQMNVFWGAKHRKTIVTRNKGLKIRGDDDTEKESKHTGYTVGSAKSGKYASLYNKSVEIKQESSKTYIEEYWKLNGLNTNNDIGRFELRLGNRVISKYVINSLMEINTGFLSAILKEEVNNWLRFYRVKLQDIKKLKKSDALKKKTTKELEFIKWQYLPTDVYKIKYTDYTTTNSTLSAKKSITFSVRELTKVEGVLEADHPNVKFINHTMENYGLYLFTLRKVDYELKRLNEPETNALHSYSLMLKKSNLIKPDDSG